MTRLRLAALPLAAWALLLQLAGAIGSQGAPPAAAWTAAEATLAAAPLAAAVQPVALGGAYLARAQAPLAATTLEAAGGAYLAQPQVPLAAAPLVAAQQPAPVGDAYLVQSQAPLATAPLAAAPQPRHVARLAAAAVQEDSGYAAAQRTLLARIARAKALAQVASVAAGNYSTVAMAVALQNDKARQKKLATQRDAELRVKRALLAVKPRKHTFTDVTGATLLAVGGGKAPEASLLAAGQNALACGELHGCSGHGTCDAASGTCACAPGFTGRLCDVRKCPGDCSNRGVCIGAGSSGATSDGGGLAALQMGTCICDTGFIGKACERKRCPSDCNGNGYCSQGRCQCTGKWGGPACLDAVH
mmetsp:Transcript_50899/g.131226  ORF Transcript_50899/g.131226 Transcript_50899/m.131226 type:complete len:360 (+) Transcript_50899:78-1157(+)